MLTLILDTLFLSAHRAVVISRQAAPVRLVFGAVGGTRLRELAAVATPKATLSDVGRRAKVRAAVATTNASLVRRDGVSHIYS